MPKSKTEEDQALENVSASENSAPSNAPLAEILDPNSFESVLAEYGVTPGDMYAPEPPTIVKENLDMTIVVDTPAYDRRGNKLGGDKYIGRSGALMFLAKQGETSGDKFAASGYDGFYTYKVLSPTKGVMILTPGRREDGSKPEIIKFFDTLRAGAWFEIMAVNTNSGFRTFNPIPLQADSIKSLQTK